MSHSALVELGLDRDADEAAVKRAYAARLKSRRPDDDPAAFQRLYETYQAALVQVRRRSAHLAPAVAAADEANQATAHAAAPAPPANGTWPTRPPLVPRPPPPWRNDVPRAPPLHQPEREPSFDRTAFVNELAATLADTQADLPGWLRAHPALYSLARRDELVPVLMHLLETSERLPTPEALDAMFAFFGLDLIDRRNLPLQPRLTALAEKARAQHREIVGPDLSFMLKPSSVPARRPAPSNSWPLVPLVLAIFLLVHLVRCAADFYSPGEPPAQLRQRVLERTPGAPLGAPDEPPIWRYQPPAPAPAPVSSPRPDPDKDPDQAAPPG